VTHTVYGAFVDDKLVYVGRTGRRLSQRITEHEREGTGPFKLYPLGVVEWRILFDGLPTKADAVEMETALFRLLKPVCNGTVERPSWLVMLWRRLRALGRRVVRWVVRSLAVVGAVTVAWLVAT